jgi:hypothetical protein
METRQTFPTKSCPHFRFLIKINDFCCFESLSFAVTYYPAKDNQSTYSLCLWVYFMPPGSLPLYSCFTSGFVYQLLCPQDSSPSLLQKVEWSLLSLLLISPQVTEHYWTASTSTHPPAITLPRSVLLSQGPRVTCRRVNSRLFSRSHILASAMPKATISPFSSLFLLPLFPSHVEVIFSSFENYLVSFACCS